MGLKNLQGDTRLKVTASNLAPNSRYTIEVTNLTQEKYTKAKQLCTEVCACGC